jgi:hypothetical protein
LILRKLFFLFFLLVLYCRAGDDPICVQHLVVPGYPRLARLAQYKGTVNVELEIGADGRVVSAKGTGANALLVRASEENALQWVFERTAMSANSTLKRTITYIYSLAGKKEYYDSPPLVVFDLPNRLEITAHPPDPQPTTHNN